MKRHFKLILAIIIIGLSALIAYGVYFYFKPMRQVSQEQTDYKVTDKQLIEEFTASPDKAGIKYLDKIMEISGEVKKTEIQDNANNVIFDKGDAVVIVAACLPEEKNKITLLRSGSTISLRGICKGFIKGDDVFGTPGELKIDQCTLK
ncbi:MAG: uncharacterized protein JWN78_2919 [Bacteroidota bacterium]|nr:uncharacterized protein [Bacteroidota bacterium]